ncbi:MAG: cytochrome c oxidase subunit 3 [Planctomycetota bacterium]|jgi:cytochrome c oxidase subunit 3
MTTTDLALDDRDHAEEHDGSSRVAHHFDSMSQQYEAGKLGMWLFVATEVLLFGGLFCAYAVFRGNHPEVFTWGSQFLDVKFGAVNTVVLIVSSVTMAMAVTFVQRNRRWPVIVAMGMTFLCGVIFMAIKSVEYEHKFHDHLVWGVAFYDAPHGAEAVAATASPEGAADPVVGKLLWDKTCRSCHGLTGEGVTGQGKDIRGSEFIQQRSDAELVEFIKIGRMPFDPLNTTGVQMPPRGGNPMLKDPDLFDIVAYVRSFLVPIAKDGDPSPQETPHEQEAVPDTDPTEAPVVTDAAPPDQGFWIPRSSIPDAPAGPSGVNLTALENPGTAPKEAGPRPANAHVFFGFYFVMTGLHAVHVLAGLGVIAWLMFRTVFGHFGRTYFTPIDLGGLYWHVVDLIWIFLFPLFYLIG